MKTANISFRVDAKLKKDAENLFNDLGLSMTAAFNIFLRQSVREGRLPFNVTTHIENKETLKAIKEAENLVKNPSATGYSLEEALKELKK